MISLRPDKVSLSFLTLKEIFLLLIKAKQDFSKAIASTDIFSFNSPSISKEVIGFNRETLDFNVLKPFLSDYYVKQALNAHLKLHGPNQLEGVEYRKAIR